MKNLTTCVPNYKQIYFPWYWTAIYEVCVL